MNMLSKPKISCFRYKMNYDVYVNKVDFSSDQLLSILDVLPNKKVVAIIESDVNFQTALLSLGESIQAKVESHFISASRLILTCSKDKLLSALSHTNIGDLEGLYIASIIEDNKLDEFAHSIEDQASSMVKNGIADISFSINFSENEMIISLAKAKYSVTSIIDVIRSVFEF